MSKTRSSAEVWLMGKGTEELSGSHLPTNADAFRLLLFFHVHGILVTGGGQRSYWECQKLAVELIRNKPKPVWAHWMTGVSRIKFDTPASNTELAWVACRHHVMELPLSAVFSSLFGSTGVPYFAMFKRFQQTWPSNDQTTSYEVASDDMFDSHTSRKNLMVQFCKAASEGLHQRDKEFLQMSLIFFILKREQGFRFGHQEHSIKHCGWRKSSITSKYLCSISRSL